MAFFYIIECTLVYYYINLNDSIIYTSIIILLKKKNKYEFKFFTISFLYYIS